MTTFALDTRTTGAAALPGSLRRWQAFLGDRAPAPTYDPATMADLRVRFQQVRVDDTIIHHHGITPTAYTQDATRRR
ncbi:MAG TPA: hypothetical protein VN408_15005 [Actinoplanes sp.]|nr:hypothetical protein [Actinoplanes sp.]